MLPSAQGPVAIAVTDPLGRRHRLADRPDLPADRAVVAHGHRHPVAIVVGQAPLRRPRPEPVQPGDDRLLPMIVAFPALMSQWPPPASCPSTPSSIWISAGCATSTASPAPPARRPAHRPALSGTQTRRCSAARSAGGASAGAAGRGSVGYLAGGLFLARQQRIITWHMPVAFIGVLAPSPACSAGRSGRFASPLFHLFQRRRDARRLLHRHRPGLGRPPARQAALRRRHRGDRLADPQLSAPTRTASPSPCLLMNMCVPLIDMKTQPPVFGTTRTREAARAARRIPPQPAALRTGAIMVLPSRGVHRPDGRHPPSPSPAIEASARMPSAA